MGLMNLRNALMAGKKWKNPYITDGIVAMWDGEWNAGGGVHNASDLSCHDICGNLPNLPVSGFSSLGAIINSRTQTQGTITLDDSKCYTLEVCMSFANSTKTSSSAFRLLDSYGTSSSAGAYSWSASTSLRAFRGVNWKNIISDDVTDYSLTLALAFTLKNDSQWDGNRFIVWQNGAEKYRLSGSSWSFGYDFSTSGVLTIGDSALQNFTLHSCRLYEREMLTSEIARNYAIDKARFGLP